MSKLSSILGTLPNPRAYATYRMTGRGSAARDPAKGFAYMQPDGTKLTDARVVRRVRSLAVPAAWTDVWICPFADGHIQATGRDARGRKQYRYHPLFRELRESTKYEHVVAFAQALPAIRTKVREQRMYCHAMRRILRVACARDLSRATKMMRAPIWASLTCPNFID